VYDVIHLHDGGVSDETIVRYIRDSGASYNLSEVQIRDLQRHGVSDYVIGVMRETES
jgi:hypothetical protein